MSYHTPINDLRFALRSNGLLDEVLALPPYSELDLETVDAILEEAGKFAEAEWSDSNQKGDVNGAKLINGKVQNDPSFKAAYNAFCESGWVSLASPVDYGGQGLPSVLGAACEEMWYAGNLSLSLLPMLTNGAINAISKHASEEIKDIYLNKMTEGIWAGTMNLTEPNAGTDLAQVACKAEADGDAYRITGQKIFITWGDHELTENIIHLVLARLPNSAKGVRGISLFVVPKYLVQADGSLGEFNGVQAVSLEHKMGIHGSPTCVMAFNQAKGYIIGKPGTGLLSMFTMMNHARLSVGIEGHAVAERAFQNALSYAKERIQSRDITSSDPKPVAIIHHPDIRRMLLIQKATLEAQRALFLMTASLLDKMAHHPNPAEQKEAHNLLELMIPIIKAFLTENGTTLTNMALQIHGGMGYIEETGVAQFVRDVRITPIYEGTNGIQALDLVGRKTATNGGAVLAILLEKGKTTSRQLSALGYTSLSTALDKALLLAQNSIDFVVKSFVDKALGLAITGSMPYLMQIGTTLGAIEMGIAYLAAQAALNDTDNQILPEDFYRSKLQTVDVYFAYVLPQIHTYAKQVQEGAHSILNIDVDTI